MPAIVDFPTVVKNALPEFGPLFANEPERKHFAEYLTGLMVARKKNVSAINSEFATTTDQSCLNRWITESQWDEEAFNLHRINWLQTQPDTRFSAQGVIPIDNVLVDHDGKLIEDAGFFERISAIVTKIPPGEWGNVFSLLWNFNPPLTKLFNDLIIIILKVELSLLVYIFYKLFKNNTHMYEYLM